ATWAMPLSLRYWTKLTAKKLLPTPPLPLRMRISLFIGLWIEFANLSDARAAWTIRGCLGFGRLAGRSGGWRRENELVFTLGFDGGKPFPGSAAMGSDGFPENFVTEISNGCLARWQTVLGEQFSDGAV